MDSGNLKTRLNIEGNDEIRGLAQKFDQMIAALEAKQKESLEHERTRANVQLSEQVAHDIHARVLKNKLHSISPEKGGQNSTLYPLKESVDAIYKKEKTDLAALKLQREKAEARLAEAKAIKVEMENAATEKSLIPLVEAEKTFGDLVVNFKTRLEALPSKATFMIKNMSNPKLYQFLHLKAVNCLHIGNFQDPSD